jgi:hypothetical protein
VRGFLLRNLFFSEEEYTESMHTIRLVASLLLTTLLLTACQKTTEPKVAYGPVSGTGTLIPAELSLVRRGSHMLVMASGKKYYVESKTENLQSLEGLTVFIEGRLEKNASSNDAPVIVVEKIRGALGDEDLHVWNVPSLNLRIKAPSVWTSAIANGDVLFSLRGETDPLLTIRSMTGSALPPGRVLYVQNRRAVASDTTGAVRELYILENERVIRIHFDPSTQASVTSLTEAKILESQFDRLLSNLQFISDTAFNHTPTGSGSTQFCGGEAKILCSVAQYCDITDTTLGTGICKQKPLK